MIGPILFLDVDGVLNCFRWYDERPAEVPVGLFVDVADPEHRRHLGRGWRMMDPRAVARLNRIAERVPGLVIVLSSSWRIGDNAFENTRRILVEHGLTVPVIAPTPVLCEVRGREIRAWLDENAPDAVFAIVDDDDDMDGVEHRFVKTSFFKPGGGLLDEHVDAIVALLSMSP